MQKIKKPSLNRRRFLQSLVAAQVLVSVESLAKAADKMAKVPTGNCDRRVPVLQNWTDENSAIVTVLGCKGWTFSPAADSTLIQIALTNSQAIVDSDRVLYQLKIDGLSFSKYSSFCIYGEKQELLDIRSLKGLDLQAPSPKIAVMSCSNYRALSKQKEMWEQVHAQSTDIIFFIGDIVYSNSVWGSVFRAPEHPNSALGRFIDTWDRVDLYQQNPLVPLVAVWDDHDFGQNNGDSENPYKDEMRKIFRSFYPLPESHSSLSLGPSVSFRMTAFGIDFHFLDGRYFSVAGVSQWGDEQEKWLCDDYRSSSNPAWLMTGTQYFFHAQTAGSVEKNAPRSLEKICNLLREHRKPTVLVSGDVHASLLQELSAEVFGYRTYEITSSAIHSISARGLLQRPKDAKQLFYSGRENFLQFVPSLRLGSMVLEGICATVSGAEKLPAIVVEV